LILLKIYCAQISSMDVEGADNCSYFTNILSNSLRVKCQQAYVNAFIKARLAECKESIWLRNRCSYRNPSIQSKQENQSHIITYAGGQKSWLIDCFVISRVHQITLFKLTSVWL